MTPVKGEDTRIEGTCPQCGEKVIRWASIGSESAVCSASDNGCTWMEMVDTEYTCAASVEADRRLTLGTGTINARWDDI